VPYFAAVYGYAITKPINLPTATIEPVILDFQESNLRARDQSAFRLTAIVRGENLKPKLLFNLDAVLAFVERLDVLIADPIDASGSTSIRYKLRGAWD
jgi:hypothetical protein